MEELVKYIGVKIVEAKYCSRKEYNEIGNACSFKNMGVLGSEDGLSEEQGYAVTYPGGYKAWCPKAAFEAANRKTDGMPFGMAIEALSKGLKVARNGWNGKGMYLTLIMPGNASHQGFDMQPCIGMKTAQHVMQPGWLASQPDMLADDWCVVD